MSQPNEQYQQEFRALLSKFGSQEERLQAIRDAVALADAHGDLRGGVQARLRLVHLAEFSGRYDESLVAFIWCLGVCDKHPEILKQFSHTIHWDFKWIVGSIPEFANISRQQIEQTLDRMQQYYERAGLSLRAVHDARAAAALDLGDLDQIPKHRDAWLAASKDGSQDCAACEASGLAHQYLATQEFEKALKAADGLIQSRLRCAHQPHFAHGMFLLPLLRHDQAGLAQKLQLKSYPKIRGKLEALSKMGSFLSFLAITGQLPRGQELLESLLHQVPNCRRERDRFDALIGVRHFLKRLQKAGRKQLKLRLPQELEFHDPSGTYKIPSLLRWTESRLKEIAAQFDRRNGNAYVSSLIRANDDLLRKSFRVNTSESKSAGTRTPATGPES